MLYVEMRNNRAIAVHQPDSRRDLPVSRGMCQTRNDWKSIRDVEVIAQQLTDSTRTLYLAVDHGPNVSPRYDIIEAPKLGDKVSYAFNGDSYPDGEITKISAGPLYRRIQTSTGGTYYRRHYSARWVKAGGTWAMVQGHVFEQNPSF